MALRILWEQDEALILLNALLKVLNEGYPRKQAVEEVSATLRQRAIAKGIEIDDTFRNINGISMRMEEMRYILTNGEKGLKHFSKLFVKVIDLYKNNRTEYENLLREAKSLGEQETTFEKLYVEWLSKKVSPQKLSDFYLLYPEIETFCLKRGILRKQLFKVIDLAVIKKVVRTVEENKVFQINHKRKVRVMSEAIRYYYQFAREYSESAVKERIPLKEEVTVTENTEPEITEIPETSEHLSVAEVTQLPEITKLLPKKEETLSETVKPQIPIADNTESVIVAKVDFTQTADYTFTKPISFDYFGEVHLYDVWNSLYVGVLKCLYEDYPQVIEGLKGTSITRGDTIDFCDRDYVSILRRPMEIFNNVFAETNLSAENIVRRIKRLLDLCYVDYENLTITYRRKTVTENQPSVDNNSRQNTVYVQPTINDIKSDDTEIKKENVAIIPYKEVLKQKFAKGFRLGSGLDKRKFRRYYKEIYGKELDIQDSELEDNIRHCGIVYEEKLFVPDVMVSEEIKEKLMAFIRKAFSSGKTSVHYEALFKEFSDEFLGYYIYNADMLKAYLTAVNTGEYCTGRSQIIKKGSVALSPFDEVRQYLIESHTVVKIDELCSQLFHIPKDKVIFILGSNPQFVRNAKGEYFHANSLSLTDNELNNIAYLIETEISQHGYISGKELLEAIRTKYTDVYEEYAVFSDIGWRDALKYKLGHRYYFKGNIISSLNDTLSMSDVFADFAQRREHFTLDEVLTFAEEMGTIVYWDSLYENALRISENEFIAKNLARFQTEEIDSLLEKFCRGNYMAVGTITDFWEFPYSEYSWNNYLLECYVAYFSKKFELMHNGYNRNCVVGAIVRKQARYKDFDELVTDILSESDIALEKISALDYLVKEGYLARRSYANIEKVLIRAKAQRNGKGI